MKSFDRQAKDNPLFSIIVPVYKTEQYLPQCVESILAQSFQNFELILVDDGSPDGCGTMCDQYATSDSRVRVIHKDNGGLVSARKAGATACIGEYIINVDSDDYISTNLLDRLSEIIDEYTPDVIVYDGYRFSDHMKVDFRGTLPVGLYKDASLKKIHNSVIQDDNLETAIVYGICLKAVRRDLYIRYQTAVPTGISIGEDLAVTAPLLTHCESVFVSGIQGYYYRDNPKSIMNTFQKNEVAQIRLLSDFLTISMGEEYRNRINVYTLTHYFDFLDRALLCTDGIKSYNQLIQETADQKVLDSIKYARCTSSRFKNRLLFWLMNHHYFTLIWVLRHIKKR